MASKKNNLPKTVENNTADSSSIIYANEVVATIAGVAAGEIEGIAGMSSVSGSILGRNKNITKGVKVEVGPEEVSCDLYIVIEYGRPIQKVAAEVQENVRKSLETMTGLHVVRVDVHVQGVSFDKENDAMSDGAKKAMLSAGEEPGVAALPPEEKPAKKKAARKTAAAKHEEAPAEENKPEEAAEPAPEEENKAQEK